MMNTTSAYAVPLLELIRRTSAELPRDVRKALEAARAREVPGSLASSTLSLLERNRVLAQTKSQPLCQDTGSVLFYVDCPVSLDQVAFGAAAVEAVREATRQGLLRQNSVDVLTGANDGTNIGPGAPTLHFHQHPAADLQVRLVLKGGGCENVGVQYSLPEAELKADRDLAGCRRVILDAVWRAQGKGCAPGILGVCLGGDRVTGYAASKRQFLRLLEDQNPVPVLADLEREVLEAANELGIGPMGFGGRTTLLGVKVGALNRVPASFFVSVSYMCWAFRRQGVILGADGAIERWLY